MIGAVFVVMSHAQSLGSNDGYDSTKVVLIDFAPMVKVSYAKHILQDLLKLFVNTISDAYTTIISDSRIVLGVDYMQLSYHCH